MTRNSFTNSTRYMFFEKLRQIQTYSVIEWFCWLSSIFLLTGISLLHVHLINLQILYFAYGIVIRAWIGLFAFHQFETEKLQRLLLLNPNRTGCSLRKWVRLRKGSSFPCYSWIHHRIIGRLGIMESILTCIPKRLCHSGTSWKS